MDNDWADFRIFKLLMEGLRRRNFRVASEHLHTSQSSFSDAAKQFLEQSGVRLYELRKDNRLDPTEAGEALIEMAPLLFHVRDEVIAAVKAIHRGEIRDLHLGCGTRVDPDLFNTARGIHKRYLPACQIHHSLADSAQLAAEVIEGKIDAALITLPADAPDPVRIVELTDAQALETSIVENLQRRDVHPLDEATGYVSLLHLDYTVEQIAAKCGKNPSYVAARARLAELAPAVTEAFAKDDIGVGHALLLAKLQPEQQEEALAACYQETYTNGSKPKRILLPVRHLQQWIEHNILLELAAAPFSKEDAQLVPEAGSCVDCPKRTGHNTLLFAEIGVNQPDSCSDPKCYAAKIDAHVKRTVAAKPKLVQISTAYGKPKDGSAVIPRNKYIEIRHDKPQRKNERDLPEYKSCKYTAEAIVTEGTEKGETKRVCANPECPVHHPKKQQQRTREDASFKAEQEKRRREEALAQATGLRVLKAIGNAVPVRLMKRDLLFLAERLTVMLDERRLSVLIRQHGIGKPKENAAPAKLLAAFLPKAEESKLGRILVETVILLSMHNKTDAAKILRDAAHAYKVGIDAISASVKQEFAAKEKRKANKTAVPKSASKPAKKAAA